MKSSWAGAVGLTQAMPTEYFKYAIDGDGDGKIDLWRSVADALAFTARQLEGKGWVRGQRWGYEVIAPPKSDCSLEGPPDAQTDCRLGAHGLHEGGRQALHPGRA